MPFDIVRQGILASLTGGWATFEPAHSLFCNTLHLYVWMTLFALPILLGIILTNTGTEQYGYGIALGYLIVISIIFIIIKSVILWLHHIFDTIQPIKYKSKTAILNSVEEQTAQQRPYRTGRFSGSSFSATRATESNAIDMIEMFDIHRPRSELQQNIHSEERSAFNQDINKINGQHIEGHNKLSDKKSQQFLPLSRNTREILHGSAVEDGSDSSSSSSSTSKCSAYGLLNSNEASSSKQIRGAILPTADSMDLLPVRRRSKTRLTFKERNKKLSRCHQKQRKYSEPSNLVCSTSNGFGSIGRELRQPLNRRKSEERRPYAIRRFNSTSTTVDTEFGNGKKGKFASLILQKTGSLGTHFPGGILVDELELNRWSLTSNNRSSKHKHQTAIKDEKKDILAEEQVNKIDGIYITSKNKEHNYEDDKACTSNFSANNGNIIVEKEFENHPSTSQFNSTELNQPSTSTATIPNEKDLKGQITKFLEEMIEKHPDTLMDAIESVRINRLYQQIGTRQQNRDDEESILQSQKNQLLVPSHQHKPHVALDAADTSQGAVHTFQDESGNWFTYSFGSHSSGTAQPLITANEMFRDRRHRNQNRHLVRIEQPEPSTHLGLPITATVVLERSSSNIGIPSKKRTNETVEQENNIEENPHYPTNVNVVNRKRSCSSSSFSSMGEAAKIAGNVIPIPISRSSSSDSATHHYLPHAPTNVFRADTVTGNRRTTTENDNDERTIASLSMRSQNNNRQLSESSRQLIAAFMQRICQGTTENPEFRSRIMIPSGRRQQQQRVRTDSDIGDIRNQGQTIAGTPSPGSPSVNMNTVHLLNDLQMNRTLPPPFLFNFSRTDPNRTRLKYYYKLKIPLWMLRWWPFGGKTKSDERGEENSQREFKLKIDRLSLASLFDRNFSIISSIFDVFLALLIGILTVSVLSRGIYTQFSLLAFAFVVAASQFSLLKSVQPDASSPVHGFNYLVAYSRPIYFIILAIILLSLDWVFPTLYPEFKLTLAWQPSWLRIYSNPNIIISPRDICAHALLWLPIAFTIGLLPQINTLVMHLSEQIDMHIFGGTASLTLFSALFSLARSIVTTGMLIGLLRFIEHLWPFQTSATIAFSALIAFTSSMAYLLSRTSTNPLFIQLVLKEFWKSLKRREDNQMEKIKEQPKNSQMNSSITTLTAPSNKQQQLLRCCIFGSTQNYNTQQQQHESSNPNRKEDNVHEQPRRIDMDGKRIMEQQRKENELISGISMHTLLLRSHHDIFSCFMRLIIIFGIHCTSVFRTGQPYLEQILAFLAVLVGVFNHHIYPQLRAKYPWKLFSQPFLRPFDFNKFEMVVEAKMTLFEKIHAVMICIEKDILYPMLFASLMTTTRIWWNTSLFLDSLLLVCAFRLIRTGFAQPQQLYIPLFFTCLIQFDKLGHIEEIQNANFLRSSPLLCLFLLTIFWSKLIELLLKLHFILCYIAPWQISWGSAFHAFAQPFSVPHSGLMLAQAIISSIISAPLNPFLGSSFFLMSYIRPVKFWERDYNTKRIDHSKLRLASQLDRGPMVDDDSNLNSIFYEHLTRSLQKWLAGDLLLGRWACSIRPGDCFILASNYLNCMVQLVEIGNGFVTFQLRGLEFRGTYCHQREMEAISEDWADSNGACCCCSLGRIPRLISFNNAWTLRWLAWEVTVAKYVVDGYSISDNSAVNMLQVHELRRLLVTLYVKCMIYYAINSSQFEIWLSDETILKSLEPIRQNQRYIEHDSVFCAANDEDYDLNFSGLSRQSFVFFYGDWIEHCMLSRSTPLAINALKNEGAVGNGSPLFQLVSSFSFALSILGRRALGTAAYNRHANAAESFLFGMHALFKGDMRITHPSDEWVFTDPEILTRVISPSVRMALKLHQDNFAAIVDLDEPAELYERINSYKEKIFISHEHDPAWRKAILANTPSLLALRHICEDGQDDYKVIMLNKRHLDMRVIKLNRECVRAFWAGQQQELIFLRNKNPERGSIQNARQVLRNMINSSADQPIGYPIYVSPLVTSFIESHPQMEQVLGPTLTFNWFWQALCSLFSRLRNHFGTSGSSTSAHNHSIPMATFSNTIPPSRASVPPPIPPHQSSNDKKEETIEVGESSAANFPLAIEKKSTLVNSQTKYYEKAKERRQNSISHSHLGVETAHSQTNDLEHIRRNSATDFSTIIGGILDLKEVADEKRIYGTMIIQDTNKILPRLNEPLRSGECLVQWPSNGHWLSRGGAKAWPPDWRDCFREGRVVHRWSPFHPDQTFRSHAGQIYLLEIENKDGDNWFVPVMEEGIRQKNKDENNSVTQ